MSHRIGEYYIELIGRYFSDSDIYIGINQGSSDKWRKMIAKSGLRAIVADVPPHLWVNSNVAGFQAALSALRDSNVRYDHYWFGHSKGTTHSTYEEADLLRWVIEKDFWTRRAEIEAECDPLTCGAVPALPMPAESANTSVALYLRSIYNAPYRPIFYIPTYTYFGMGGRSLNIFLEKASKRFFAENILNGPGVSRYFFEGGFSWIADMAGFEPYLLKKETDGRELLIPTCECNPNDFELNQLKVAKMIEAWKADKISYYYNGWGGFLESTRYRNLINTRPS
ncbi:MULTISPECIES: hypothetical protein [Methylobacterium]|uniref:hypothetical protein n=1 Tax=Methylobacterium TaxID=407 RepID=UPI00272DDA33|nr:hypothetical protein [Methylobacterium sp.]